MKIISLILILFLTLTFGCARVDVGGTEKPIKVDVTMRVDVYQHVVKEIDGIEDMVRSEEPAKTEEPQSFLNLFCSSAWAADFSPQVQEAVSGRKARLSRINQLLSQGVIGENNQGVLTIRKSADSETENLVSAENIDRETIYQDLALRNNASIDEIRIIYAEKMQVLAPAGSSIQDASGNWKIK
jgi:uncharacterized protein YdbL (DUF1318 family)